MKQSFALIGRTQLTDGAKRCVLRAPNVSKCVCSRGSTTDLTDSTPPDLLAGFGKGRERDGLWRVRGRKGDGKGEVRKGRGECQPPLPPEQNSGYGLAGED